MALKDVKTARKGQMIYVVGLTVMIFLSVCNGLLLYATYHDCDPLTTKLAKAKDQLMPLLVMNILKDWPGLPGLFIAGIFSAALSSLSTGLNAMSAVVLEDFCKPFMKDGISEQLSKFIMRGTVLALGVSSVALVYVVQRMGTVLQLAMSLQTACIGPMFGVYIVGFLIPWIGKRSVFYGAVVGFISMMLIVFKAQTEMALGNMKFEYKPMSVSGCRYNFTLNNETTPNNYVTPTAPTIIGEPEKKQIYHISYLYYSLLGALIAISASFVLSVGFCFQDPTEVDPKLLAPFIRKFIKSDLSKHKTPKKKKLFLNNFDDKENI